MLGTSYDEWVNKNWPSVKMWTPLFEKNAGASPGSATRGYGSEDLLFTFPAALDTGVAEGIRVTDDVSGGLASTNGTPGMPFNIEADESFLWFVCADNIHTANSKLSLGISGSYGLDFSIGGYPKITQATALAESNVAWDAGFLAGAIGFDRGSSTFKMVQDKGAIKHIPYTEVITDPGVIDLNFVAPQLSGLTLAPDTLDANPIVLYDSVLLVFKGAFPGNGDLMNWCEEWGDKARAGFTQPLQAWASL